MTQPEHDRKNAALFPAPAPRLKAILSGGCAADPVVLPCGAAVCAVPVRQTRFVFWRMLFYTVLLAGLRNNKNSGGAPSAKPLFLRSAANCFRLKGKYFTLPAGRKNRRVRQANDYFVQGEAKVILLEQKTVQIR